jgi:hypothetical protein
MSKSRKRLSAVLVLIFMSVIVVLAVYLPGYIGTGAGPRSVKANIPLIRTSVKSSEDGKEYTVQSLFTVEMDNATRSSVSNNTLHEILTDIVSDMDISDLTSPDGVEYMNRYATEELNRRLSALTDTQTNVYAYDFFIGDNVQFQQPDGGASEFFDSLSNPSTKK